MLVWYSDTLERRVKQTDTTNIHCCCHEASTGVIRVSQSFEYRERLDECSVLLWLSVPEIPTRLLHVAVALKRTRVDLRSAWSFMTCGALLRLCGPQ